jgi:flagellar hook assembly protein FlgD
VLNQTVAGILVKPLLSDVLRVESALVYPNPVKAACRFTFMLSRQADVRVRVYSLAGRLVRDLGFRPGDFGYNDIEWDGRDSDGNKPANGVYLFALTAQVDEGPCRQQRVTVRDKLLVFR